MDDEGDAQRLGRYATELADALAVTVPRWIERCILERAAAAGLEVDVSVRATAAAAARAAEATVVPELRSLLAEDIDEQRTNPLSLLRGAVRYATDALGQLGVEPPRRDEFARRAFPHDHYDLGPAAFADVDPSLEEPGLLWGAAKAHVHLARRRAR